MSIFPDERGLAGYSWFSWLVPEENLDSWMVWVFRWIPFVSHHQWCWESRGQITNWFHPFVIHCQTPDCLYTTSPMPLPFAYLSALTGAYSNVCMSCADWITYVVVISCCVVAVHISVYGCILYYITLCSIESAELTSLTLVYFCMSVCASLLPPVYRLRRRCCCCSSW